MNFLETVINFAQSFLLKKIYMNNTNIDIQELNKKIHNESSFIDLLNLEMNKVIIGQKKMTERLLIGLLSNGHILLEGVPGLAKTLAINTLSKTAVTLAR